MNSIILQAEKAYSDELACFELDPDLLALISGGDLPQPKQCPCGAEVTTTKTPTGSHSTVDCSEC